MSAPFLGTASDFQFWSKEKIGGQASDSAILNRQAGCDDQLKRGESEHRRPDPGLGAFSRGGRAEYKPLKPEAISSWSWSTM